MRFAYPYFLILFLLILYLIFRFFYKNKSDSSFVKYSDISLIKFTSNQFKKSKFVNRRNILAVIKILAVSFAILAMCRPQAGNKIQEVLTQGYDIILCLDTSSSMKAEDFKPKNRFFVAKQVTKEFIKARPYDRLGLVIFSGIAFTQCPLTMDHGALLDFLDKVEIGSTNTDGTAIGSAIATSVARLKNVNAKAKIVILVTDGRNNTGEIDPITASKIAKTMGVKIYTIGVGKKGEALFPIDDPIFGKRYVKIQEDLDEGTLTEIASLTDAKYFRATNEYTLREIYKIIDGMEKSNVKIKEYNEYKELYLYFLIPALILLILEILLGSCFWVKIP